MILEGSETTYSVGLFPNTFKLIVEHQLPEHKKLFVPLSKNLDNLNFKIFVGREIICFCRHLYNFFDTYYRIRRKNYKTSKINKKQLDGRENVFAIKT